VLIRQNYYDTDHVLINKNHGTDTENVEMHKQQTMIKVTANYTHTGVEANYIWNQNTFNGCRPKLVLSRTDKK
jgi:hypothetical protein